MTQEMRPGLLALKGAFDRLAKSNVVSPQLIERAQQKIRDEESDLARALARIESAQHCPPECRDEGLNYIADAYYMRGLRSALVAAGWTEQDDRSKLMKALEQQLGLQGDND